MHSSGGPSKLLDFGKHITTLSIHLLTELQQSAKRRPIETQWVALTGAPSSGKSTIAHELIRAGYSVIHEQARDYMASQLAFGRTFSDVIRDRDFLAKQILEKNLKTHAATSPAKLTVFDRGLPDILAFTEVDRVLNRQLIETCSQYRFSLALVFEPVSSPDDPYVYHTTAQIKKIADLCENVYAKLGTLVVRVPSFSDLPIQESISDRLDFVRKVIAQYISDVASPQHKK